MYIEKDYSLNHWSFGNNVALLISCAWFADLVTCKMINSSLCT